jgi:anti-sigma factor RsiW
MNMLQVGSVPTCQQIVEAAGDYVDGGMPEADRATLEQHLVLCDGCDEYLHQMRTVLRGTRELAPIAAAPAMDELLSVFRSNRHKDSP